MAFSNLKKVTFTSPFPNNFIIERDSLIFPYVIFGDASYQGSSVNIGHSTTGVNQRYFSIWGNMQASKNPFLNTFANIQYAFVPNGNRLGFNIPFSVFYPTTVELYILELDTNVGNN